MALNAWYVMVNSVAYESNCDEFVTAMRANRSRDLHLSDTFGCYGANPASGRAWLDENNPVD